MKQRFPSLLLALAPLLVAADKPVLVPDISARQVQIRYSFNGAQLLLFGAVVYPGGRPPDRQVDIAVVLRGPVQPILVREKEKIAGIWMNADSNRFRSAPSFYAVASSRPISDLMDERTAAIYELGLHNLQLSPGGGPRRSAASRPACSTCDGARIFIPRARTGSRSTAASSTAPSSPSRARCPSVPTLPRPF